MIARTISKAITNWKQATNSELLTDWATKDKQVIQKRSDCDRVSDSFKSGRITTDFTKEQLTKYKNKYEYCQNFEVWDLD